MEDNTQKVLIVDDDPAILRLLSDAMADDHEHYGLLTASNGREALEILSREDVLLVVSDIKMPGISGLHLLAEIRAHHPGVKVILMTGHGTEDIRRKVQKSNCLGYLEKPFKTAHLLQMVREQITARDDGFAGTLKNIQLSDLIQMCCLSGTSMAVSVVQGSQKGTIVIEDGEIVHAVYGDITGEEAFYEILLWESGSFETLSSVPVSEPTINNSYQYLILEAAHKADMRDEAMLTEDEETGTENDMQKDSDEVVAVAKIHHIRVLIVDDSPMMCKILTNILTAEGDVEVVGTAQNGEEALNKMDDLKPDIITLDVNMPVMNGSTTLKHIMIKNPCPVIIISSIGSRSQKNIFDFLRLGAVDFINKPEKTEDMAVRQLKIIEKIRIVAGARISGFKRGKDPKVITKPPNSSKDRLPCEQLVVISSGAGGFNELVNTFHLLRHDTQVGIFALHDMPPEFVIPLSDYLNQRSSSIVLPVGKDASLFGGQCYIGTNNASLRLNAVQGDYNVSIENTIGAGSQTNHHFDGFLHSVCDSFSGPIRVVLLSGADVGDLEGLRGIKEKNGRIIAQTLRSCTVPGPLEKAFQAGLVDREAGTKEIVEQILGRKE